MKCDLRTLFTCPPGSKVELFRKVEQCISIFEPERIQNLKPAPEEDIQALEQLVKKKYGCSLPPSYKLYLQKMGEEDSNILSRHMGYDLKDCQSFRNMADGTKYWIDFTFRTFTFRGEIIETIEEVVEHRTPGHPPFWIFFYEALAELTYGFSPATDEPDELIMTVGWHFCYPHDTFSKLLFFCAYCDLWRWVLANGREMKYKADTFSSGLSCLHALLFHADCPPEWTVIGQAPLAAFLRKLEEKYSLEPCWFSGKKEFCLLDLENCPTEELYPFNRYVAFHADFGLTICIEYYEPEIQVVIFSEDLSLTKQISDAILEQTQLEEDSVNFRQLDWEQVPSWLTFNSW